MFNPILPPVVSATIQSKTIIPTDTFGERFLSSKFARPYRYKNRKTLTNNRTNNKKKLRSVRAI